MAFTPRIAANVLRCLAVLPGGSRIATRIAHSRAVTRFAESGTVRAKRLGTWFTLDLEDNVQRTLYLTGTYEPSFLQFLRSELKAGDTYLDVGAHIGIDAVVAARCVGSTGHVLAFEPSPDTAEKLRDATRTFGNVIVREVALGEAAGVVQLRSDPSFCAGDAATRSLYTDGPVISEVQVDTLDTLLPQLARLDVVKIDIEGGEVSALKGMHETLTRLRPRAVIAEVHPLRVRQSGQKVDGIVECLSELGYAPTGEQFLFNVLFRLNA